MGSWGKIARSTLTPPERLRVSEWAERYVWLPEGASSRPGPWRNALAPYLTGIMDALGPDDPHERVVVMGPAQCGKTAALGHWLGSAIHQAPGPIMVVQPSGETCRRWSTQKFDPMVEHAEVLRGLVTERKGRDPGNTIRVKRFRGGELIVASAKSSRDLRQMSVRYLALDDVDGYDADADGEGDPVALALKRTTVYRGLRKVGMVSTPTEREFSRIEREYSRSDQRVFEVPCPECGEYQELRWGFGADQPGGVKWPKSEPAHAVYECRFCEARIEEHRKLGMLARGRWVPTAEGDGRTAGFHIRGPCIPWVTWGEAAREFVAVKSDPVELQVFVNTYLAETWEDKDAERVPGEGLAARGESWSALPRGIVILTAGIDVQSDRLEVEVVGWGLDEESWSVDYRVLWGDPSVAPGRGVWAALTGLLQREAWDHPEVPGGLRISAACVDSGGDNTQAVYAYCKRWEGLHNRRGFPWAIKGKGGEGIPLWRGRPSRKNKAKVNLYTLGVDAGKAITYARLRVDEPGPGYCHFPVGRRADYFDGLTAEVRRTRYHHGRPVRYWWKKDGVRNEPLDCRVYALAALYGWRARGRSIRRVLDTRAGGGQPVVVRPTPERPPIGRRDDWFGSAGRWF